MKCLKNVSTDIIPIRNCSPISSIVIILKRFLKVSKIFMLGELAPRNYERKTKKDSKRWIMIWVTKALFTLNTKFRSRSWPRTLTCLTSIGIAQLQHLLRAERPFSPTPSVSWCYCQPPCVGKPRVISNYAIKSTGNYIYHTKIQHEHI